MGKQLEWAFQRMERREELGPLEAVGEWLVADVPETIPRMLVPGDYKVDNVVFARTPPLEIIGVIDWEMGIYGDPLTDLGLLLPH